MPPRIAVLPSAVADQIAAGEVVERPASVVKELIENALDAGATALDVAIEEGGRQHIRVSDDGSGMTRDDAVLSLERHATSKIRTAQDLVGVRSFGFRGEALAAICSVAHVDIETAAQDGEGTLVRAAGAVVAEVAPAARRRGTTVSVARLFYNAPARLKFLKSARSEVRAILDVVGTTALVRRDVRISLSHDRKPLLVLPAAESLRERIASIRDGSFASALLDVDDVSGTTHVSGLVERPSDVGTASRRVFLSVNGRAVRDPGIVRAAEAAYRSTIPAGVRPTLYLEVVVSADLVDVNVHPAKAEVRFHDRWQVERAVETAVRRALGSFDAGAMFGRSAWPASSSAPPRPQASDVDVESLHAQPLKDGLFSGNDPALAIVGAAVLGAAEAPPPVDVPPLMQLRRTYVMFEHADGVVLIDQHSAHERILFEQFMRTLERGEEPAQRLLFPMVLHLGTAESDAFEAHQDLFVRLGFEIEGFGGNTLIVRSVPMPHPRFDAERCLRETLATITGDRHAATAARHERLASTIACKAAIKAGEFLTSGELRALFIGLRDTTLPAHDVHGRATIVQLSWDELERRFGRR
jgi:DNA mismatch repair protein MutL